jgi:hypothetical protein
MTVIKNLGRHNEVPNLYNTSMSVIVEKSSQIGQKLPRAPLVRGAQVERKKKSEEGAQAGGRRNYSRCTFVMGQTRAGTNVPTFVLGGVLVRYKCEDITFVPGGATNRYK